MKAVPIGLLALVCLAGCMPPAPGTSVSGKPAITAFSFVSPAVEGSIDQGRGSVRVEVPAGTNVSALVAVFSFTGAAVEVDGVSQVSGQTVNDFSSAVEYRARAADGSVAKYAVSVTFAAPPSSEKSITAFRFLNPAVAGIVDPQARAILVTVPRGTDVSSLVADYETTGAQVTVEGTEQRSRVTVNDFTDPLTYVVAAEDGTTSAYRVTVRIALSSEKSITAFGIVTPNVQGAIDQEARVIRVRAPEDTELSGLVAVFATTGARVCVQGKEQASGATVNDFRSPRDYIVTAEDGSEAAYSVRVTAHIPLLINEVDVDQVGTDVAEYIELYAPEDVDLAGIAVVLINGGVTPGLEYARIDLGAVGMLAAGAYLVIAGPNVSVPAPSVKITPQGWESSNRIQNGPNDAVMIFDTLGQRIVDTVTYAGVLHRALITGCPTELDATEGSAGAPADSNSVVGSIRKVAHGSGHGT